MKKKLPRVTKLTLASLKEVIGYFLKGKPFKIGGMVLRPSKEKEEYPCCACWRCNLPYNKKKMKIEVREFICIACSKADDKLNYNWYHYLEM